MTGDVSGSVVSVNVGGVRAAEWQNRPLTTGIFKEPVSGRVAVRGVNLAGDDQADRTVHGGFDQALYAYALEDYAWWSRELGEPLEAGRFGENLTTRNIDPSAAVIGERWRVGSTTLEVSQPRIPCYKLAMRMHDPAFVRRFLHALRPGTYLRIVVEGDVGAGDAIEIVSRPAHGVTIREFTQIYAFDHARASRLLEAAELSDGWKEWALRATS